MTKSSTKNGRSRKTARPAPPPLPQNWSGEPRFAVFFIPLNGPLPISAETLHVTRKEQVPWLAGIPTWPTDTLAKSGAKPIPMSDENFVSMKFWHSESTDFWRASQFEFMREIVQNVIGSKTETIYKVKPPKSNSAGGFTATLIEAVTPLLAEVTEGVVDAQLSVSRAFDRCLEHIEELVTMYAVSSGDHFVTPVSRQTLLPVIAWTTRDAFNANFTSGIGPFLLNIGTSSHAARRVLSLDETKRMWTFLWRNRRGDPFMSASRNQWRARRALYIEGDTASAVLDAATCCEITFNTVLLLMAWERQEPVEQVAIWFQQTFGKRLRTYFSPRLGGNWDISQTETPLGRWNTDLQLRRHRAIHAGYVPSGAEAKAALAAMDGAVQFLAERVAEKRTTYPRTAFLFLGTPGLERRGMLTGKTKQFLDQADTEPDWLVQFQEWAKAVETAKHQAGNDEDV